MKKLSGKVSIIYGLIVLAVGVYMGRTTTLSGIPYTILAGGGVLLVLSLLYPTQKSWVISSIALGITGVLILFIHVYESRQISEPFWILAALPICLIIALQVFEKNTEKTEKNHNK